MQSRYIVFVLCTLALASSADVGWHRSGTIRCSESSHLAVLPAVGANWSEALIRPVLAALENGRARR